LMLSKDNPAFDPLYTMLKTAVNKSLSPNWDFYELRPEWTAAVGDQAPRTIGNNVVYELAGIGFSQCTRLLGNLGAPKPPGYSNTVEVTNVGNVYFTTVVVAPGNGNAGKNSSEYSLGDGSNKSGNLDTLLTSFVDYTPIIFTPNAKGSVA